MKWTRLTMNGQTEWCLLGPIGRGETGRGGGEKRVGGGRGEGGGSINMWCRCDVTQ